MAADVDLTDQVIDGRYRIECRIGRGGMGTVWRARHIQTLQCVAIKTLRTSECVSVVSVQRCLREARAAAAIRSRHIVRVIDVQPGYCHEGAPLPYLVMELLEGIDFETLVMQRGALSLSEVVWAMRQVARGVQCAHEHAVVHRDLKPSNLFLTADDDGTPLVKICDFGLAKVDRELLGSTALDSSAATGMVVGTPRYMAPEQLRGPCRAQPSIDRWAIGLIAYRLLSGDDYFGREQTAVGVSLSIVHDEMPLPSTLCRRVPRGFDAWFMRSCARDPSQRFQSAMEQLEALVGALGQPEPSAVKLSDFRDWQSVTSGSNARNSFATVTTSAISLARMKRSRLLLGLSAVASVMATAWAGSRFEQRTDSFENTVASSHSTVLGQPVKGLVLDVRSSEAASMTPTPPSSLGLEFPKTTYEAKVRAPTHSRRRVQAAGSNVVVSDPRTARLVEQGQACARSLECASRLCVAERCR